MAKPLYIDMFKDVNYNLTKGFVDRSNKTTGNANSMNSSKTGHRNSNTYNG